MTASSIVRALARRARSSAVYAAAIPIALATLTPALSAQYFGRNKVQYEHFAFDVLRTKHFDLHYYADESLAAHDAARMLERWNARLSTLFSHPLSERKPIVLYADQPDFQQTNVIGDQLDESTGGVTESMLDRMVLPLTGSYAESDHVLGHEMVHVFQYDIVQNQKNGFGTLDRLPSWLVEGMAEYLSLGGQDANTAMWLRDAVLRNDLPTIKQLNDGRKYFPYRYGEALWAYIGGTWGDDMVPRLFRTSLQDGFDNAVKRTLGMSVDSLSTRWRTSIRGTYGPLLGGRQTPSQTGAIIAAPRSKEPGQSDVSPAISSDGRYVAFFSSRNIGGFELVIADAATGRIVTTLAKPGVSTHFDALSFLYSAGTWSPDGKRFAFITYSDGDNVIEIADVASRKTVQRIRPRSVGAITTVAWSPDGTQLAFSGMQGGISDLYLYTLANGETRRLTNDRFADLQPAWSPDGKTIAFATDRGAPGDSTNAGSDFDKLRYVPLRLATIDVASGAIRVLPVFPGARHIDPQYSADGTSLYFVSDAGGFSDIYRLALATGETFRVTHAATGVSGVTATSPAISVARETGRLVFSVFDNAGFRIATREPNDVQGEPVRVVATPAPVPTDTVKRSAAVLPSDGDIATSAIERYLGDADTGLPDDTATTKSSPYRTAFHLAAIGQPSFGASVGGVFGTQFSGGASAYFTDMLGDHSLGVAVQASGQVRDLGGQLMYLNTSRRWNWGASVQRIPYLYGYGAYTNTGVQYTLAHIAVTGASVFTQYPLSQSRRFEIGTGYTHYGYALETIDEGFNGQTNRNQLDAPPALGLTEATAAFVGDASFFGFTSPISGTRYRFEVTPTIGSLNYQTALADVRRYFFAKPFTLAFRGLHYGRYGRDADSDRIGTMFLGDGSLVRGYSYESFGNGDCTSSGTGSLAGSSCPQFDRLLGSRLAVANLELRIPLLGTQGFGIISSPLPPMELAPFVDAGVAWTGSSAPVWQLNSTSGDRTPVVSAGIASRWNLFGFAVLQIYYAHPFQRPGTSGTWGFLLQPGW